MKQPAVFLDLNGTLVLPVQAESPAEYRVIPGAADGVALLNAAGFLCPVVTVQSRIARGTYTEAAFDAWFAQFQRELGRRGAGVLGPYTCPHQTSGGCACAKPQPSLYRQAAEQHGIDLARSWVVGDTESDVRSADAIGARGGCYVWTGWGPPPGDEKKSEAAFVGDDMLSVARWILRQG